MIIVILVALVGLIVGISILVKKLNEGNETAEGIVGTEFDYNYSIFCDSRYRHAFDDKKFSALP